jgi:hypothetical protein
LKLVGAESIETEAFEYWGRSSATAIGTKSWVIGCTELKIGSAMFAVALVESCRAGAKPLSTRADRSRGPVQGQAATNKPK